MAHEFESGFFVKQGAWHRLGTVLGDAPTTADAIIAAGLDWEVIERPVSVNYATNDGMISHVTVPDYKALVRSTDSKVLSVVGSGYQPLQNKDAFSWFDPFVSSGKVKLETAGALRGGRRVWVLARIVDVVGEVVKNDPILPFLLLSNGHDGQNAIRVGLTATRVVCMNTLGMAERSMESGKEPFVKIHHHKGMKSALELVQNSVSLATRTFEIQMDMFRRMRKTPLPMEGFRKYIVDVFKVDESLLKTGNSRIVQNLSDIYCDSRVPGQAGIEGTVYGAFNAVTYFLDHKRGRTSETRLDSTWFGMGKTIRDRAVSLANQLIN